jgi:arabinose-5-phosphate isomerase
VEQQILSNGQETINSAVAELKNASERLGSEFVSAVKLILESKGKIVVTGLGKSGHVGRKIASTFSSTGTSSTFLHPSEALHGDFGMLQSQDVLVAIAYGGETAEVVEVAKFARRSGLKVVAMTGSTQSTLASLAHVIIDCKVSREADPLNLAPTNSSTLTICLGDALAVSLMQARGFTKNDFANLHPGGLIGRKLSLVRDHMHQGSNLPKVHTDDDFHKILEAVTMDNFGIAAVVQKDDPGILIGAISDGDLRRALLRRQESALSLRAGDLMSSNPLTVFESALAIDAALAMSEKRVSRLFVLENIGKKKKLVGLVRLQDLLAAKIF